MVWKPRLFVLNGKLLTYYRGFEDAVPRGQIDLTKAIISLGKPNELVVKTKKRIYTFLCDFYGESASDWVSACIAEATATPEKPFSEEDLSFDADSDEDGQ